MARPSPRIIHLVEQYLAFSDEVHRQLRPYHERLLEAGWSEAEAWALTHEVEHRLLSAGEAAYEAGRDEEVRIEEEVARRVREVWEEAMDRAERGGPLDPPEHDP
jgi:hypothetical protein